MTALLQALHRQLAADRWWLATNRRHRHAPVCLDVNRFSDRSSTFCFAAEHRPASGFGWAATPSVPEADS